jgi:hypothetical protein
MGVLVNYQINDLTADDIVLIGEALDLLPHGRVQKLFAKIQPQITDQETAERDQVAIDQNEAADAWRESERTKLKAELAKPKSTKKGR